MERVWYGPNPWPRRLLLPLAGLYALGWEAYRGVYTLGLKQAARPHPRAVVVGNLAVGGSGKTPGTIHVAEVLTGLGYRVTLGASGYGSPRALRASLAPDGPLHAAEWGDEPALLRDRLPNLPLIVGRDRVLAGRIAHERDPGGVLLMDDGLQHLRLATRVKLLLDSLDPPNPWCFPAGPYREPRWNRKRADLVLPGPFRVEYDLPARPGEPFHLLTAIARPERFVEALGAPLSTVVRPDHDPLDGGTLLHPFPPGALVATTEKDWTKLRDHPDRDRVRWFVAPHRARIEPAAEFARWLQERLGRDEEGAA